MNRTNGMEILTDMIKECRNNEDNNPMKALYLENRLTETQDTLRIITIQYNNILFENAKLREMIHDLEAELRSAPQFNTRSNY